MATPIGNGLFFQWTTNGGLFYVFFCNWLTLNLCQIQPDLAVHFEHLAKQKCKHAHVVSIPKVCVLWVDFTPPKSNIDTDRKMMVWKMYLLSEHGYFGYLCSISGGVSLSSWQDDFRPFHLPEKLRLASFLQAFLHLRGWANVPTTKQCCYELCSSPRKIRGWYIRYVYI